MCTPRRHRGGAEVQLRSFLTTALNGANCSTSRTELFSPGEITARLGGQHGRWVFWRTGNLFPSPRVNLPHSKIRIWIRRKMREVKRIIQGTLQPIYGSLLQPIMFPFCRHSHGSCDLDSETQLIQIMTQWMVAAIVLRHRRPTIVLYMSLLRPYLSLNPPGTGRKSGIHRKCTLVRKLKVRQKLQAERAGRPIPTSKSYNLQSTSDFGALRQTKLPEQVEFLISETSGFRRRVVDGFTVLGCYAAQVGRWLPTFRDILLVSSSTVIFCVSPVSSSNLDLDYRLGFIEGFFCPSGLPSHQCLETNPDSFRHSSHRTVDQLPSPLIRSYITSLSDT